MHFKWLENEIKNIDVYFVYSTFVIYPIHPSLNLNLLNTSKTEFKQNLEKPNPNYFFILQHRVNILWTFVMDDNGD